MMTDLLFPLVMVYTLAKSNGAVNANFVILGLRRTFQ